jgi:subtilase family serine protease
MLSLHPRPLLCVAILAALAACSPDSPLRPSAITAPTESISANGASARFIHARVCPGIPFGAALCHSLVRVDNSGSPLATSGPTGYNPGDLRSAYKLTTSGAATQVIAIVDAFDDPNAEADLGVYRSQFGLAPCTTANGCFRKVNQTGGTSYPRGDQGWAEEISLDLDMASAICPGCHILLVEAKTNSFANLAAAVDEAARLGATVISNSYGGNEYSGEVSDEAHFNHPGIAITVSSGDNGFGVEFPAASQYVTAVGGTTLKKAATARGFTETVWSGAGSGCSAFITKPAWQPDKTGCARRTVADVSAVADPNTGVSVYDTYRLHPGGWLVFGGTSVAAPLIGAVYALAGNAGSTNYGSFSYSNLSSVFDVVSGSNGTCGSYLCTAGQGYDGPTGNGTPNGTGAF